MVPLNHNSRKHGLVRSIPSLPWTALSALAICLLQESPACADPVDIGPQESATEAVRTWRDGEHAGMNVLYVLLRAHGLEDDYAECVAKAPGGRPPNTVSELMETAAELGHPLTARSITPSDLANLAPPVLVHYDGTDPDAGTFLMLLDFEGDNVIYVDGASATVLSQSRERFFRGWSGVVLYPASVQPTYMGEAFGAMIITFAGGLFLTSRRRSTSKSHTKPFSRETAQC